MMERVKWCIEAGMEGCSEGAEGGSERDEERVQDTEEMCKGDSG